MSRQWMPWYPGDFERDTRHLSAEKIGVYVRLINHYWCRGKLPTEEQEFANIAGIDETKWLSIRSSIGELFVVHEGNVWTHKRLDKEIEKAEIISLKRTLASHKALEAKGKRPRPNGHQMVRHKVTQPQPHIKSTSSSIVRWKNDPVQLSELALASLGSSRGGK